MKSDVINDPTLSELAKLLGDCCSVSAISDAVGRYGIKYDPLSLILCDNTYNAFKLIQKRHRSSRQVFAIIEYVFNPVRFVDDKDAFEANRRKLNQILAFSGFEYGADGKVRECQAVQTLTEAERRYGAIYTKIKGRNLHPKVLEYCEAELSQNNSFHAVLEAAKGLAQRIREMSGSAKDGAALVDEVFSRHEPILAFNALQTKTERSEHRGFAALLRGCFAAIRNPTAHEPKIHWEGDDYNAADYLTLISLLHRKIDACHRVDP